MSLADRDLLAIHEDGLLIDVLAGRGDVSAFADDPIAQLLGNFAAAVDHGIEARPDQPSVEDVLRAEPRPLARSTGDTRRTARVFVAAGAAVLLFGTSGVAAAVTGDPFSAYKSLARAVTGSSQTPVTVDEKGTKKPLPSPAATAAQVSRSLKDVRGAIRQGNWGKAQRLLDELKAGTSTVVLPPGVQNQVENAQVMIDTQDPKGGQGTPQNTKDPKDPKDPQDPKGGQGTPQNTKDPKDPKDPQDPKGGQGTPQNTKDPKDPQDPKGGHGTPQNTKDPKDPQDPKGGHGTPQNTKDPGGKAPAGSQSAKPGKDDKPGKAPSSAGAHAPGQGERGPATTGALT